MLRTSTDPGAPFYAAFVAPGRRGHGPGPHHARAGRPARLPPHPATVPAYLWVSDAGNTLTAYSSSDGYVWSPIPGSAATVSLGPSRWPGWP